MLKKTLVLAGCLLSGLLVRGQQVSPAAEQMKALTSEWKGERSPDGRPRVSDALLARLAHEFEEILEDPEA